jgi:hypothetical protein
MKKARDENYKYLVIEASFGEYFGFNMKVKKQQAIAMKLMSPNEHDDFMVVGWKVSKTLPKWVRNSNSWIDFLNGKKLVENEVFETDGINECNGIHEEGEKEEVEVEVFGKHDDDENGVEQKEDEEYEESEEDHGEEEDDLDEESENAFEEDEEVDKSDDEDKECAEKKSQTTSSYNSFKSFDNVGDGSIFASLNKEDFKMEVAKSVKSTMKNDTVDIFITGPFRNSKTGKSTWVAVFGDNGSAWTLKAQFVKGYISTLLTKVKASNISNSHADSYYDINIRKYEYGKESLWKRKDQKKTIKRLTFTFTCETTKEKSGKQGLTESIHFLFMSMKKRDINPVGPLIVDYLKEHSSSLYDYLLKKKTNEAQVAKEITEDIDKHFRAGFVLHWNDCLNHWMVDYDIIRVLKEYLGYSSWADVPEKQRCLCYKNYEKSVTLPEWDTEQERY